MNVQSLQERYPLLISHMKKDGYSGLYISKIEREIQRILLRADEKGWKSYTDVYLDYTKTSQSSSYLYVKRTILGAIENFETLGINPGNRHRHSVLKMTGYDALSKEFKSLIDYYCKSEKNRGKKETTIYTESHNATTFLLALQKKDMDTLEKITEKGVLEIFTGQNGSPSRSYSYKKNIAAVLNACVTFFPQNLCVRVLSYLPALRQRRKNIQYLTSEEISRIKSVLTEKDSALSLRDKAIGLLVLYTGLRGCDIAGLTMADIDWLNDRIHIRQQKTNVPFELPLAAVFGNAIYDYLTLERPKLDHPEIFLTQGHPYTKLQRGSISNIARKIMFVAKIREMAGDRKGFHLFRHHVATALLGNGIPQPTISRTLGHTSPASLDSYLSADFPRLKECSLSIERFPLRKEVLN